MKRLANVLVDDLLHAPEARGSRRHQRADEVWTEAPPHPADPLDRQRVAVFAANRPMMVVEVFRTVERGRETDLVAFAEREHLIVEAG